MPPPRRTVTLRVASLAAVVLLTGAGALWLTRRSVLRELARHPRKPSTKSLLRPALVMSVLILGLATNAVAAASLVASPVTWNTYLVVLAPAVLVVLALILPRWSGPQQENGRDVHATPCPFSSTRTQGP